MPREIEQLSSQLKLHDNLEAITRDLVTSEEFSIQMLPQLVARWTENYTGRRVFFLHLPKTAGTSVRLALSEAMGIPSILMYRQFLRPTPGASFWPLWTGHASIQFFPQSHTGFTVFREPRSRLLSQYRQRQQEILRGDQRITFGVAVVYPKGNLQTPAKLWAAKYSHLHSFFHPDEMIRPQEPGPLPADFLTKLTVAERSKGLSRGLKRIEYSAWAHDEHALKNAVESVSGGKIDSIPRENTFEDTKSWLEPVTLTRADLESLERAVEFDQVVIGIASSLGLIPKLNKSMADDMFAETAKRLKFRLP